MKKILVAEDTESNYLLLSIILRKEDVYKRQLNMLFALRTIQQRTGRDLGATFLSGTTISNSLTGTTVEGILGELKGRIYYNPETDGYEVADKFSAGSVIGKAERIEAFLRENPDHAPARESLEALREATPKPLSLIHISAAPRR